jgi:hypothetical protein
MSQLQIKNITDKSKGLVSLVHWDTNQVILKFNGKLLDKKATEEVKSEKIADLLQVGQKYYLDLSGDISFFIRHSCNPNTTVKVIANNAFLISTRQIKPNEELTFDYSITSTDNPEDWNLDCTCGSWNCRKSISGFNTLPLKIKETYLNQDIVPTYIKKHSGI